MRFQASSGDLGPNWVKIGSKSGQKGVGPSRPEWLCSSFEKLRAEALAIYSCKPERAFWLLCPLDPLRPRYDSHLFLLLGSLLARNLPQKILRVGISREFMRILTTLENSQKSIITLVFRQLVLRFRGPGTSLRWPNSRESIRRFAQIACSPIRKILAPIKIKSALTPPPPKTQNYSNIPPKTRNFMDLVFSCRTDAFFQAFVKLAQPFPAPEIADKNFTDTRIFLSFGLAKFGGKNEKGVGVIGDSMSVWQVCPHQTQR